MNAKLNIYKNCSSETPTKTYECKRFLFGVSKKALSLHANMQESNNMEEQIEAIVDIIQTIFPDFKREEINFVDNNELMEFIGEIIKSANGEMEKAAKK